ncbi:MAG TPA: CpsD/CapB family tyrosine-protein kinase, partial [Ktedonobacteraceae bacterium]|nr:CpsD/CapB family tyrosine-protein kinase [Ktedonobacteraceae bacterium]
VFESPEPDEKVLFLEPGDSPAQQNGMPPSKPERQLTVVEEPIPLVVPDAPSSPAQKKPVKKGRNRDAKSSNKRSLTSLDFLQEQCRHLCLSLFFDKRAPVHSLGFTSSLKEEGKTFLAALSAGMLAKDSSNPVILMELNWEHPTVSDHFKLPSTPGLAEWLRGECSESAIRYEVGPDLIVIPAGNGKSDAVRLLHQMRQQGIVDALTHANELLIVDLPAVITTAYGSLAASLLEALIIVVRAGETSEVMVAETCTQLKEFPVHGVILNQVQSRVPRWLQQIL